MQDGQRNVRLKWIRPSLHNKYNPITLFYFIRYLLRYKKKFSNFKFNYNNINRVHNVKYFLATLPRSGTGWIHNVYKSVIQQKSGLAPDIKYTKHGFFGEGGVDISGYPAELDNYVAGIGEMNGMSDPTLFNKFGLTHGHHPIQWADLIDINNQNVKPIFTLRDIYDCCKSWLFFWHIEADKWYGENQIGMNEWDVIEDRLDDIIFYYNYWGEYVLDKVNGQDYLLIKYENLRSDSMSEFRKLFDFYKIPVEESYLLNAIDENSFENTVTKIIKNSVNSDSFTGISIKNKREFNDELKSKMNQVIKNKLIYDFGYQY